jgi:hypothetical protein
LFSNFNEERLNEYHQTNDNTTLNETTTTQNFAKKDNTVLVDKSNTHENESSVNMSEEKNKSETLIAVNENDYDKYKDIGNERFVDVKLDLQRHHNEIAQMDKKQSIANDLKLIEYEEFVVENEEKTRKIDVGIELASVSNYSSEGTGNGVNIGGGIAAAYHITDKIRVTTGVMIAKQSIEYAPENNYQMAYADYAELNTANIADNQTVEKVSSAASEVSFIAIDIPLNVQFKHKRVSFSTGFSSLLFVQEKYNRTYNTVVSNKTYNTETRSYDIHNSVERISKDETSDPFDRFDFARLLNLSVGYDIPIAKRRFNC